MKTKYPIKPNLLALIQKELPYTEFVVVDDHHIYNKANGGSDDDFIVLSVVGLMDLVFQAYALGQKTKLK